ncbi:MAG: VOC family protein [Bacteroidota bacterium]
MKNTSEASADIATFLTFQKQDAEEAMNFYISLFENSEIVELKRWEVGGPGKEGTVMHASFNLNGKLYMCSDSPAIHEWGFTPAVSNFVECIDENQQTKLFEQLSDEGKVMMPLDNYGFSQRFGFVEDRFGISWQLNLK